MNSAALSDEAKETSSRKRPRLDPPEAITIPVLHDIEDHQAFFYAFCKYQAVFLPAIARREMTTLTWKDLSKLFESMEKDDQDSWCIENGTTVDSSVTPTDFLQAQQDGYASFLLQKCKILQDTTLERLPVSELPGTQWTYGPCLWFFFGVNSSSKELPGRPEHTDSVSHDGTWHYQLSGCKRWFLRPTDELLKRVDDVRPCTVTVQEGDVLVVNTRLWWHRTVIPSQPEPSVSYARDFFTSAAASDQKAEEPMSNVDGLYAANDIEEGTILFTEDNMPDCELHRSSTDPNCEIVQLEDGTGAVVSCRKILSGEFFCVAESEDEDASEESSNEQQQEEEDDDDS